MPLYEYRCRKCGVHLEKIQKFSDPPLKTCQRCGGQLERLLSPPSIQFKGSGWYVTDYARKSATAESGKSEPAEKPEGPSTSESKAEAKSEPAKTAKSKDSKPASRK